MQMASSPKFVSLFFLLITLFFSLQTYARDSHFFSKVSRNREEDPTTTTTTPTNTNKFFINNKQSDEFEPLNKQEEPQPTFLPQTTESGYGLYGHETGLDPPSTTTTTSLYNMDDNNINNNKKNNNHRFSNFNNYYKNSNENNHHEKNYAPELKGLSTTSYSTNASPSKFINNNNNNHYSNNNNNFNNNDEGMYYGTRHNGMQEKQGMSDTRFMENGKYYYDVNKEENYDPNNNNYMSYSNKNHINNYETNGYYGNNDDAFYGNHNSNFFHGNGMKGYRNQIPQDERFDFDDQP